MDTEKTEQTDLKRCKSGDKNLRGADLRGVDLRDANLSYANLSDANLSGADLSYADLRGVDLRDANLSYANLRYANLSYANLSYANLSDANLSYANLRDADLSDADLSDANLRGADLSDADFPVSSHDVISEILRRAANDNIEYRMIAGLVIVSRDMCWSEFAEALSTEHFQWALSVLAQWKCFETKVQHYQIKKEEE